MRRIFKPSHAVIFLACLMVGAVLIAVLLLLSDLKTRELERSRLETQGLAQLFMRQTEHSFESADMVLQGVQERLQTPLGRQFALNSEQVHLLLNTRAHALNATGKLLLVNQNGDVVNGSVDGPELGTNVANQNFFKVFQQHKESGLFIDRPSKTQQNGLWTLNLSRQLSDDKNQFRGVIVVAVQIASLEQLFNHVKLEYDRPISIYLTDGTLVASSPHRETLMGALAPELHHEVLPQTSGELRLIQHQSGDGGGAVFYLGRLKAFPFLISVINQEDLALASWRETSVPIAIGAFLMLIVIVSFAGFLVRELTQEERMTMALDEAHVRYLHTVESVMDAIVGIDENQLIQIFNPAAESMFQMKAEDVLGKSLAILMPNSMQHAHVAHVKNFSNSSGSSRAMAPRLDVMGRRSDGSEFPIESTISKTLIGGKLQMTAVLRDVTQRRQAENDLKNMNTQLRALSASLQEVREQERSRISRELHDDLGQQLTGLKLELAWLSSRIKDGREIPLERVTEMKQMLNVAIASVRRISTDLRPLILDDLGFSEAVEWHAAEVAKRSNLQIELDLPSQEWVDDDLRATALFRIVQEALTNVLKHTHAERVWISFSKESEFLCLRIQDDGQGMPEKIKKGGIGLVSMRERVASLGGEFTLKDVTQNGVKAGLIIEVRLPMEVDRERAPYEN